MLNRLVAFSAVAVMTAAATAQLTVTYNSNDGTSAKNPTPDLDAFGQVNVSGATLFRSFFGKDAATVDAKDVDGDGQFGFNGVSIQQLASSIIDNGGGNCSMTTDWVLQYRAIGSVNGVQELVDWNRDGLLPDSFSSDDSFLNRSSYASGGAATAGFPCTPTAGQGALTGTPFDQLNVLIASVDVPFGWAVQGPGTAADADPFRNPFETGYGRNDQLSLGGSDNLLVDATGIGTVTPNVVDFSIVQGPVSIISNRGADLAAINYTDAQFLWLTGRLPNGENLNVGGRDSGSGTRNGFSNSLDIDPSWLVGDNRGVEFGDRSTARLGPQHNWCNSNSSSRLEEAVENNRLLVAYTGTLDSSKAAFHYDTGELEITDFIFDNNGGVAPVRVSVQNIVENSGADGYQIGGPVTLMTVGDFASTNPADPNYLGAGTGAPTDADNKRPAAEFLNNLAVSFADFTNAPAGLETLFGPAEELATNFILLGALDSVQENGPGFADPSNWVANGSQVAALKTFTLANANLFPGAPGANQTIGAYGAAAGANRSGGLGAGLVPDREANAAGYVDGTTVRGEYVDYVNGGVILRATNLSPVNAVAGDANFDGVRDGADIAGLVAAVADIPAFAVANSAGGNDLHPHIAYDFDGNGDFDAEDIRFFADGLATYSDLDRKQGFTDVDVAFGGNFFGTAWADGQAYQNGDSRFDIAGDVVTPRAEPTGANGIIDAQDLAYIAANFGDFSVLSDARNMDLSADVNGDLVVDFCDYNELAVRLGLLQIGDINGDGAINTGDIDPFVNILLGAPCPF